MGAINSCCIPSKSGIECHENHSRNGGSKRSHRRNLSATFNMTLLVEDPSPTHGLLNINTATEEELMTLPGINRPTAQKIIEYRKQIGGYKRIEDVALVSGVGAVKLDAFRQEICVSDKKESSPSSERSKPDYVGNGSAKKDNSANNRMININTSNVFQFMKIRGIGQTLAENIVSYRDDKGPFKSIDDLVKVKGIGPATLALIRHQLTLEDIPDTASYSSSRISSNVTGGVPSRNSDVSLTISDHPSVTNEYSKSSLENLVDALGPVAKKPLRPTVEPFNFKCKNKLAVRIASWNLERFSEEKADNPGVRDVVCMTILENGLSLIAVQELADRESLQKICDELNQPVLPNVQQWSGHRGQWKCVVSEKAGRMYQSNEFNGFLYDTSQGISLISTCLLDKPKQAKRPFVRQPFIGTFKIKRFDCVVVSVHLKATGLDNEDLSKLQEEIDRVPALVDAIQEHLPDENDVILLGDFNLSPDAADFDCLRSLGYKNTIQAGTFTNISNANAKGSQTYDNIWITKDTQKVYTGQSGVVRDGLSSPWIPNGWGWGGVVSDHCPVWAQFYSGKDLDKGNLVIGSDPIRFAVGAES